jgi:hypothetical protein
MSASVQIIPSDTGDAMHEFLDSYTFKISETARGVNDAFNASPNTVFFIDVKTTVSFMGQSAKAIKISVIDAIITLLSTQ